MRGLIVVVIILFSASVLASENTGAHTGAPTGVHSTVQFATMDWDGAISEYYSAYQQRDYRRALTAADQLVALAESTFPRDHPNLGTALNNRALALQALDRLDEAAMPYQRAIKIFEQSLGPDDPDTLAVVFNLASLYQARQQLDGAIPLFERVHLVRSQSLGLDHSSTVNVLNRLLLLYQLRADYWYERVDFVRARSDWASLIKLYGVSTTAEHLAKRVAVNERILETHHRAEDWTGALGVQNEIVRLKKFRYGEGHPLVAAAMDHLADYYRLTGKHQEALQTYQQSAAIYAQTLGQDHAENITPVLGLVEIYQQIGDHLGAEPWLERLVGLIEVNLDASQQNYSRFFQDLSVHYRHRGDQARATTIDQRLEKWRAGRP